MMIAVCLAIFFGFASHFTFTWGLSIPAGSMHTGSALIVLSGLLCACFVFTLGVLLGMVTS